MLKPTWSIGKSPMGKGTLHLVHSNFSTIFLVVLASADLLIYPDMM